MIGNDSARMLAQIGRDTLLAFVDSDAAGDS